MTNTWQSQVYGHMDSRYRMITSDVAREVQEALEKRSMEAAGLTEREVDMLRLRFGAAGPPSTLQAIGDRYGLTRERVRQIINRSLRRLHIDPWG